MTQQLFVFWTAFLGSAVESTEALTIVLAVDPGPRRGLLRGVEAGGVARYEAGAPA